MRHTERCEIHRSGIWCGTLKSIWGYVAFNSDGDTIYTEHISPTVGRLPDLGGNRETGFQQPVSGERHLQFRGYVPISQSSEKRSGTDRGIICARNLRRHHNESGSSAHARKFSSNHIPHSLKNLVKERRLRNEPEKTFLPLVNPLSKENPVIVQVLGICSAPL